MNFNLRSGGDFKAQMVSYAVSHGPHIRGTFAVGVLLEKYTAYSQFRRYHNVSNGS